MKISSSLRQRGNKVSLLLLSAILLSTISLAQTQTPVFVRVVLQKVHPGKEADFEKFMKETMKPVHELRKKKGKITNWRLYRVHFTGANDEYNYVSVNYYNSWPQTQANDDWPALMKEADAKADPVALGARFNEMRTIVRQMLYYRQETVTPKTPVVPKFVMIDFMKVRPGMMEAYMAVEKDWKAFHQNLADNGKAAGWGLWSLVLPSGSARTHDFVTSNGYSAYAQVGDIDYAATFKAVYPSRDPQAEFDRADKARDLVKSELWELIMGLDQ